MQIHGMRQRYNCLQHQSVAACTKGVSLPDNFLLRSLDERELPLHFNFFFTPLQPLFHIFLNHALSKAVLGNFPEIINIWVCSSLPLNYSGF